MGNHSKKTKKKQKGPVGLLIICLIIISILGIYFGVKHTQTPEKTLETSSEIGNERNIQEQGKQIQIFSGNDRPVACMIDNHSDAWPQYSINDAYIVYEIIVEGGETRLMALFKGKEPEKVGPMRSSRHYFLDYALENDAIYAHIGWSPQAQSDISTLGINNINGLEYDTGKEWKQGDVFWRLSTRKAPHNSILNIKTIKETATKKGYSLTSNKKSVLKYVADEFTLEDKIDKMSATNITIPFSTIQKVNFKYDSQTKRYTRYARTKLQTDATTSTNITTKNIIITFAENYTLQDVEDKDRQGLKNIGTKNGYYITNGQAIPITCTKEARNSQTIYKDKDGNEINVNDGNTFIEICPINADVTIE